MKFIFSAISYEPGFSFGICLPASCTVDHLQTIIDEQINAKTSDVSIQIPNILENVCQTAINTIKLETLDVIAM